MGRKKKEIKKEIEQPLVFPNKDEDKNNTGIQSVINEPEMQRIMGAYGGDPNDVAIISYKTFSSMYDCKKCTLPIARCFGWFIRGDKLPCEGNFPLLPVLHQEE